MSEIKVLNGGLGCNNYTAGEAIAKGDLVIIDGSNGKVDVAATNEVYLGVALNSAATDETVLVEEISSSTKLQFPVETGTAAATSVGDYADLASGDGLTLTASNNDVIIKKFVNAATVVGHVTRSVRG